MAAERLQPRGERQADLRALYLGYCAMAAFDPKHGPKPREFFPHLFGQDREQTPDEMLEIMRGMATEVIGNGDQHRRR